MARININQPAAQQVGRAVAARRWTAARREIRQVLAAKREGVDLVAKIEQVLSAHGVTGVTRSQIDAWIRRGWVV